MMEKKLTALFAYQHVEQEPHLRQLIAQTEERWPAQAQELDDETLELVAAAGEPAMPRETSTLRDAKRRPLDGLR